MRMRNEDPFIRFAAAGWRSCSALQSAINMAVNLHLMPAKGMTLPFISYGGSSMISLAYGMGMLLALTRERPRAESWRSRMSRAPGAGLSWPKRRRASLLSPPAAPAAICFRPRRWRRRSPNAASRSISRPMRAPRATPARFRPRRIHVIPSATIRGRNPLVAGARPARVLGYGLLKAWLEAAAAQAGGGRRLRRLSDHPAGAARRRCAAFRP